jgi:hypothetical protein
LRKGINDDESSISFGFSEYSSGAFLLSKVLEHNSNTQLSAN